MARPYKEFFPQPLTIVDGGTFTGALQQFGSPTTILGTVLRIVNDTDVDVFISWNGVDLHDIIPTGVGIVFDVGSNKVQDEEGMFIRKKLQFFFQGSVAAVGTLYMALYGPNNG